MSLKKQSLHGFRFKPPVQDINAKLSSITPQGCITKTSREHIKQNCSDNKEVNKSMQPVLERELQNKPQAVFVTMDKIFGGRRAVTNPQQTVFDWLFEKTRGSFWKQNNRRKVWDLIVFSGNAPPNFVDPSSGVFNYNARELLRRIRKIHKQLDIVAGGAYGRIITAASDPTIAFKVPAFDWVEAERDMEKWKLRNKLKQMLVKNGPTWKKAAEARMLIARIPSRVETPFEILTGESYSLIAEYTIHTTLQSQWRQYRAASHSVSTPVPKYLVVPVYGCLKTWVQPSRKATKVLMPIIKMKKIDGDLSSILKPGSGSGDSDLFDAVSQICNLRRHCDKAQIVFNHRDLHTGNVYFINNMGGGKTFFFWRFRNVVRSRKFGTVC